ncbi:histidine phosphatase family protein [Saccharibacillus sp. CPCC 101409]|uniref:histidine phosphatase family protein n=1 Tax=Saccharibacillus sp. CPCC 101409 TaxID=3058041 RepID=UPI002671F1CD|nr:histidine phosphatase family protein [Saccharibacillus sp. CPCC 101409]MDO3410842.1 histidine phosphatase family protein [Saccharibacillus sp. CPCC 101409]
MIELLVVRHGESQADLEDRHEGRADFVLTPLGERQAGLAAAWIARSYRPHEILASPLKRAARTAEAIAQECGIGVAYDEDLMEWDNGLLAGLKREEASVKYPLPASGRQPHDTFAEAESEIQFRARAEAFLSGLLFANRGRKDFHRICIVSHGGTINMLFHSLLKLPFDTGVSLATGDTGIHLWRIDGSRRRIVFTNAQEHLRG